MRFLPTNTGTPREGWAAKLLKEHSRYGHPLQSPNICETSEGWDADEFRVAEEFQLYNRATLLWLFAKCSTS
jgi:hypothetical protein